MYHSDWMASLFFGGYGSKRPTLLTFQRRRKMRRWRQTLGHLKCDRCHHDFRAHHNWNWGNFDQFAGHKVGLEIKG